MSAPTSAYTAATPDPRLGSKSCQKRMRAPYLTTLREQTPLSLVRFKSRPALSADDQIMIPKVNRTPPAEVRKQLRREVGFGCPVKGCCSPYLSWHHFDPPWAKREHHNPEGMVALCRIHHDQADRGAFTVDQLKALKLEGRDRNQQVAGRFNWMRQQILAVVGGNFYYEVPTIIQIAGRPVIWWNRSEDGLMLLNVRMLSASSEPRAWIEDNDWISEGVAADIECPPSGKLLRIDYLCGDQLRVEFMEIDSPEALTAMYGTQAPPDVEFPLTVVEVQMEVANTPLSFSARESRVGGGVISGSWMLQCQVGIFIE